jgi:thymidylate synthase
MQTDKLSISAQVAAKCDVIVDTIDKIIATLKQPHDDRRRTTSIKIRVD